MVDTNNYFNGRKQGDSDSTILPSTFPHLITKFRWISESSQRKFLNAALFMRHMEEVWTISRSLAFVAVVSAIETLMSVEPNLPAPCASCGIAKTSGATQRFAEFVDAMVKGAIPKKQRLAFYNRRSRIVHGEKIAVSDEISLGRYNPVQLAEDGEQRWLTQIARVVLHNWLIAQSV